MTEKHLYNFRVCNGQVVQDISFPRMKTKTKISDNQTSYDVSEDQTGSHESSQRSEIYVKGQLGQNKVKEYRF